MATVDVAVTSRLSPQQAWKLASDLSRFNEWLTIFGGWRSEVPAQIEVGTCVASLIKVKGFRNTIRWCVTRYDEPELIEMVGKGKPGVCIRLSLHVAEKASGSASDVAPGSASNVAPGSASNVAPGSEFRVVAELSGGLLNTRLGNLVAKLIESDVRKSVANLAALS